MDQRNREELSLRQYIGVLIVLCGALAPSCGDSDQHLQRSAPVAPVGCGVSVAGCADAIVVCGDAVVKRGVRIGLSRRSRTPNHRLLQVRLPIRNVAGHSLRFGVQLDFLDANYVLYGDRTTRRVVTLAPGQSETVIATSSKEKATSFIVRLARM